MGLDVELKGDDIVVSMPGTIYSVSFYRPLDPPKLMARHYEGKDDPRASLTHDEFFVRAQKRANQEARELGWIT